MVEVPPFAPAVGAALRAAADALLARRRRARQGDRAHDQSRRQGGRVLAEGALRRRSRGRPRRGVHPFRVHVRGHQQPGARPDAGRRPAGDPAAGARPRRHRAAGDGPRARGPADAVAHARPAGDADDARQGTRQRGRPAGPRAARARAGAAEGQDQRRRRQLQRAPGRVPRRRVGAARGQGGRPASASSSIPTRRRSSRTTAWPNSSTRSPARTPS